MLETKLITQKLGIISFNFLITAKVISIPLKYVGLHKKTYCWNAVSHQVATSISVAGKSSVVTWWYVSSSLTVNPSALICPLSVLVF